MRYLAMGALLAACGGASKTAPAESKTPASDVAKDQSGGLGCVEPCELTTPPAVGEDAPPPVVEEPPPPARPTIWERIRVATGPMAGLEAYSIELVDDPKHCGGKRLVTTRNKKVKIAKTDQVLADFVAVEYPLGLDLTPSEVPSADAKTLEAWLKRYTELRVKVSTRYGSDLEAAKETAGKVAAEARLAQVNHRLASVLVYAEIPVNYRPDDTQGRQEFCDILADAAEPILARGDEAARSCAEKAASVTVEKSVWWQKVCVVPAP